ncbi:hypothetical protein RvY_09086 [Ramazzottius varieornatus]|uniref:Uncharacterized protein n=1 Tax=Ramazzottius varieornatus TaxID=947166 RepID=A0A1D1V834_RAMVA|nr:hypothetical protein RvY_09086 [Ramazzottius varieornatus]
MIPYPRLGRYMDYATLNALAEYLKQNYNSHGRVDTVTSLFKMAEPSAILQRELRDMKGKGYGIPIPRVGKRSIQDETGEQMPPTFSSNGKNGLTNQSLRAIISEYFRSMENNVKRQQQPRTMQFTPRVGRADPAFSSSNRGRPIPRVGRR